MTLSMYVGRSLAIDAKIVMRASTLDDEVSSADNFSTSRSKLARPSSCWGNIKRGDDVSPLMRCEIAQLHTEPFGNMPQCLGHTSNGGLGTHTKLGSVEHFVPD
jgi:hypothetical protein